MLYHLLTPLADQFQLFNVFRYLTFRTGGAVMTALLLAFLLGPSLIRWMRRGCGASTPGSPGLQSPAPGACSYWLWER